MRRNNIEHNKNKVFKSDGTLHELFIAAILCIFLAFILILSKDLKSIHKIALLGGVLGSVFLISFPKRRILLVIGWVIFHPLSIEKVFFIGEPLSKNFLPSTIVVSASDVMLFYLALNLIYEKIIKKKKFPVVWHGAIIPYLVLMGWSVLVFFLRGFDHIGSLAVIHHLKMLIFLFIMVSSVRTPGELKVMIYSICVAVLLQVLIVNFSFFKGIAFSFSTGPVAELMSFAGAQGETHIRATGTVGHVNQQASFLTFFGLPLIALLISKRPILKFAGLLTITGCVVAIGMTFSRSAWFSLAFGILAIIIIGIKQKDIVFRHWIYITPLLISGFIALSVISQPILGRLIYGDEGATSSRKRAIFLAFDLYKKHPIAGVGSGNFAKATLDYFPPEKKNITWRNPGEIEREVRNGYGRLEITQVEIDEKLYDIPLPVHNKYLLILSELGGVGFFIFLWFQYRVALHVLNSIKADDKMFRWIGIGIAGAFSASQCYMNLDLFADDKTMEILLIIAVLSMLADNIGKRFELLK